MLLQASHPSKNKDYSKVPLGICPVYISEHLKFLLWRKGMAEEAVCSFFIISHICPSYPQAQQHERPKLLAFRCYGKTPYKGHFLSVKCRTRYLLGWTTQLVFHKQVFAIRHQCTFKLHKITVLTIYTWYAWLVRNCKLSKLWLINEIWSLIKFHVTKVSSRGALSGHWTCIVFFSCETYRRYEFYKKISGFGWLEHAFI